MRILLGLLLLVDGLHAVRELSPDPKTLVEAVELRAAEAPIPFSWLGDAVVAAPERAAWLLRWGLLVSGIGLMLGALVRPLASLLGVAHLSAYFLDAAEQQHLHLALAAIAFACVTAAAGRTVGFDATLDGWLPRWLTWAGSDVAAARSDPFSR